VKFESGSAYGSDDEEEDVKPNIWELDARARAQKLSTPTPLTPSKKRSRSRSPNLLGGERDNKYLRTPNGGRSTSGSDKGAPTAGAGGSTPPSAFVASSSGGGSGGAGGEDDPFVSGWILFLTFLNGS
jgi:hypothetical protein